MESSPTSITLSCGYFPKRCEWQHPAAVTAVRDASRLLVFPKPPATHSRSQSVSQHLVPCFLFISRERVNFEGSQDQGPRYPLGCNDVSRRRQTQPSGPSVPTSRRLGLSSSASARSAWSPGWSAHAQRHGRCAKSEAKKMRDWLSLQEKIATKKQAEACPSLAYCLQVQNMMS